METLKETLVTVLLDKNGKNIYTKEVGYDGDIYEEFCSYDENKNRTHKHNSDGCASNMKYDENNNMIEYLDYAGFKIEYTNDKNGNILLAKDSRGELLSQLFNDDNQITSSALFKGNDDIALVTAFKYDKNGDLISETNRNCTITNTYDENHNILTRHSIRSYESIGVNNQKQISGPFEETEYYEYNERNMCTYYKRVSKQRTTAFEEWYEYDENDSIVLVKNNTGLIHKCTYKNATEEELLMIERKCKENEVK